jgi:type IV secretory pathway VirJ component
MTTRPTGAPQARHPSRLPLLAALLAACAPAAALPLAARAGQAAGDAPRAVAATAAPRESASRLDFGRFGELRLLRPAGEPGSVTLLVSGADGWDADLRGLAEVLVGRGSVVVGIDGRRYLEALNGARGGCQYVAAEFEELSHAVQQRLGLQAYLLPVLAGEGDGAALAALVLGQSPKGTYAGLLSLAFRPELALRVAPCDANGLAWQPRRVTGATAATASAAAGPGGDSAGSQAGIELLPRTTGGAPWVMLQSAVDPRFPASAAKVFADASAATSVVTLRADAPDGTGLGAAWLAAQQALAARGTVRAPTPPALRDLPLHEVPVEGPPPPGRDAFAVLLTGDGGWAGLDQDVSAALARDGVPVVALNSLKYFWKRRDPAEAARDLQRIVARYSEAWGRRGVLLIGYSFGADVLPFLYRRLPEATRAGVHSVTLLAPTPRADFEFRLGDWLPGPNDRGEPTRPEIERLGGVRVLCLRPVEERDSPCVDARAPGLEAVALPGGHHFGGDYDALAARILEHAGESVPERRALR